MAELDTSKGIKLSDLAKYSDEELIEEIKESSSESLKKKNGSGKR